MAKKLGNSRISRVKILGILEFLKIPPNPQKSRILRIKTRIPKLVC